jgi:hypothetical protein
MMKRLERLLDMGVGAPLGEVVGGLRGLSAFVPETVAARRRGLHGMLRRRSDAA